MGILQSTPDDLDTFHVHVDGTGHVEALHAVVDDLTRQGFQSELYTVLDFCDGPDRLAEPRTYESHTPFVNGVETFKFFSQTALRTREDILHVVPFILRQLQGHHGAVVEAERVVGRIKAGRLRMVPVIGANAPLAIGFPRSPTLPIEIHHSSLFKNVFRSAVSRPLPQFVLDVANLGVKVGGLFVFDDGGSFSYSFNAFSTIDGLCERVTFEHHQLARFLGTQDLSEASTLIEYVEGIWRV